MALLTDNFIINMLGGSVKGVKKYNEVAPDAAAKAQYISIADSAVIGSAKKGGYLTVSSTNPSSGDALTLLQSMSFKIWLGMAYGFSAEVTVEPSLSALLPDHTALYQSDNMGRIDIPGFDRDPMAGDGAADLVSGLTTDTEVAAKFSLDKLTGF